MKKSIFEIVLFSLFLSFGIAIAGEHEFNDSGYVLTQDRLTEKAEKVSCVGFEPADYIQGFVSEIKTGHFPFYQNGGSPGKYIIAEIPEEGLTEKGKQAVDIAPAWLRHDLADLFKRIETKQDRWAELIMEHEGEIYIDELIFTIAHSQAWFMKQLFSDQEAYVQNVQSLYEIDEELDYVEIVDYGTPGEDDDYYSTTKYWTMRDGEKVQVELDPEIYYWYIVHPKLESEGPSIGPSGMFWREYLFFDSPGERSYRTFWILKSPNKITTEDIDGWGYTSYGYLTGFSKFVWNVIKDKDNDEPVLTCIPWKMGAVLATVLPLEKSDNPGQAKMLENCVDYGNGEMSVEDMKRSANDDVKIAIIKDRDPWGTPSVENMCQKLGFTFEVYSSADLDSWDEISLAIEKIIIPSDQTRSFYETIAKNKKKIETWLEARNILEFHGACEESEDWSDLTMPGNFSKTEFREDASDTFILSQYPLLKDVLKQSDIVWDEYIGSLPAGREFSNSVIDNLGNWQGQVKFYWARSYKIRTNQPELIAFEHDGNCGETHDLLGAIGRVALIPFCCADGTDVDHVWNEFYENGWHFYDVGREGGPSNIAYPGGKMDKDVGGRGTLSIVCRHRPDTFEVDVTEDYTSYSDLIVNVNDDKGYPVDGAIVKVYTEYSLSKYAGYPPFISVNNQSTDSSGKCSFKLGDNRNLYIRVESPMGNYPIIHSDNDEDVVQIISRNVPDRTYYWGCNLEGVMPAFNGTKIEHDPGTSIQFINLDFSVENELLYGMTTGLGFCEPSITGNIDYFITNASNFRKFLDGENFEAFEFEKDAITVSNTLYISDESYYIVLSNERSVQNTQEGSFNCTLNRETGPAVIELDSISTNFKLHPGERIVLNVNNHAPYVVAAGFFNSEISESGGGTLDFRAFVMDPDGYGDIEIVELVIDGERTGTLFRDDGKKADETAGDSLYSLNIPFFPNNIEKGLYKNYGVIAEDCMGQTSTIWPRLHVDSSENLELANPEYHHEIFDDQIISMLNFQAGLNKYSDKPIILAGGYGDTVLSENGGLLKFFAILSEDAANPVSVEILYNMTPVGINLDDAGTVFNLLGGKIYAFIAQLPSFPAGDYIFELQATDGQGKKSVVFPYYEVGE